MSDPRIIAGTDAAHPDASELAADTERSLQEAMKQSKETPLLPITDDDWERAVRESGLV